MRIVVWKNQYPNRLEWDKQVRHIVVKGKLVEVIKRPATDKKETKNERS